MTCDLKEYYKEYRQTHKAERKAYNKKYNQDHAAERSARHRQYYLAHKGKILKQSQQYYEAHKDQRGRSSKHYRETHPEVYVKYNQDHAKELKERARKYHQQYRAKLNLQCRQYREKNIDCCRKRENEYRRTHRPEVNANRRRKWRTDSNFRLACNIRTKLCASLSGRAKSKRTFELVGLQPDELMLHLVANSDDPNVHIENYGTYWHADHIVPVRLFDHTDLLQVECCWHWSNLQALEKVANLRKGVKLLSAAG